MTFDDRPPEQATPLLVTLVTEASCSLSAQSFVRPYKLASQHHSPTMLSPNIWTMDGLVVRSLLLSMVHARMLPLHQAGGRVRCRCTCRGRRCTRSTRSCLTPKSRSSWSSITSTSYQRSPGRGAYLHYSLDSVLPPHRPQADNDAMAERGTQSIRQARISVVNTPVFLCAGSTRSSR